ncbi:putative manganese-transporting ATPase PDR2 [Babesia sp. Xinjiang]|uniref:putative manganese-transporting ATPase PDR2 n=1 Tax=Babesia sp. Xinjiang TaxID=462227 RepID=UPI000A25F3B5|nr:putative manganese-transporting ATPase PDR2 [Babesia sp. Xinjiang]ORM41350.1 putative manganese-transporting ATPase PDR2 [Babesia sp. Xinjiang]
MAKQEHRRSIYRYVGRDAPFARFSFTVLALAIASCTFHARKIRDIIAVLSQSAADSDIEDGTTGLRVDFAAIAARFKSQTPGESFLLVLLAVVSLLGAIMLMSLWYVRIRLFLFYERCVYIEGSEEYCKFVRNLGTHVFISEATLSSDASDERRLQADTLLRLKRSTLCTYYRYGHRKYILNENSGYFQSVDHIDTLDLRALEEWRGLSAKDQSSNRISGMERSLSVCADVYGENDYDIPACDFVSMLIDSFLSPFFIFQLISTLIWVMDNYWYYSMLSVFSIVTIEIQMVNRRIRDYNRINSMRIPPSKIYVYRDGKWNNISSTYMYPGDIFLLSHDSSIEASVAPADCLILSGEVVVDESILTGESVPQFKSALDYRSVHERRRVLPTTDNEVRQSTIFSGTSVVLCRTDTTAFANLKTPKQGCICMVLRTGFESYQGRLVNAIMRSGERVTASTKEGWCFLGILLSFALLSCAFVVKRLPTATFKRLALTILHIITSVIPPEFPVILSMAVTIAILQLHKKGMYCTEPFRVPHAGELKVCAFDKTGTLTEDNMNVAGVVVGENVTAYSTESTTQLNTGALPIASAIVIGGCHSVTRVAGKIVGDPMEKAAFEHMGWTLTADGKYVESFHPWFFTATNRMTHTRINILRRWPFTSELGRMTTIVSVTGNAAYWQKDIPILNPLHKRGEDTALPPLQRYYSTYISLNKNYDGSVMVLCKGAPERLRPLLLETPVYYEELYQKLAIGGMRVIALACKRLYVNVGEASYLERSAVETALEFVGFLALESPIRPSSLLCMRQLEGHKLIMITGDNVLTACHVANAVEIGDRSISVTPETAIQSWGDFAILVAEENRFVWRRRNGDILRKVTSPGDFLEEMRHIKHSMRLCVTGPALDALLHFERDTGRKVLAEIVLSSTVFARVSPQQKEFIIRTFKRAGMKTAMCGDGTNDMAALKAAHVGISLLKSAFNKPPSPTEEKLANLIRKQKNNKHREMLEQLQRDLQDDMPEVKLGEASIASPFTYRKNDVLCVPLLVRAGRCALTNVVVLYKIMGINSLITSLGMSVLAVDGVNFSDAQTTLYSMLYTGMLMALSRSKPAKNHTAKHPEESIFKRGNFTSFVLQCCLHVAVIMRLWSLGMIGRSLDYIPNLDAPFEPNLVNTLVFYGCFSINIAGFMANYQGYPYMESFSENKLVYRPLALAIVFVVILVCDICRPLGEYLSLVAIPSLMIRLHVLAILGLDLIAAFAIEHVCRRFLSN